MSNDNQSNCPEAAAGSAQRHLTGQSDPLKGSEEEESHGPSLDQWRKACSLRHRVGEEVPAGVTSIRLSLGWLSLRPGVERPVELSLRAAAGPWCSPHLGPPSLFPQQSWQSLKTSSLQFPQETWLSSSPVSAVWAFLSSSLCSHFGLSGLPSSPTHSCLFIPERKAQTSLFSKKYSGLPSPHLL